jgi:hypothetical protein
MRDESRASGTVGMQVPPCVCATERKKKLACTGVVQHEQYKKISRVSTPRVEVPRKSSVDEPEESIRR